MSEIEIIADPNMTLGQWDTLIKNLMNKYGRYVKMCSDSGHNNCILYIIDKCSIHPKYTGMNKPTSKCKTCRLMYKRINNE